MGSDASQAAIFAASRAGKVHHSDGCRSPLDPLLGVYLCKNLVAYYLRVCSGLDPQPLLSSQRTHFDFGLWDAIIELRLSIVNFCAHCQNGYGFA